MKQVNQTIRKTKESTLSREESLNLVRHKLKDYPVMIKAIFELCYYSPIFDLQLIQLNVSDININKNFVRVSKNGNELYVPIPQDCTNLLQQTIGTNTQKNTPLFRNNQGQRLSLQEWSLIKRLFWHYIDP
jgi:integrase